MATGLATAALLGKAEDPVLLDVAGLTLLADYFLICSGTSDRHVRALAERVEDAGRELGDKPLHREGVNEGRWVLIDFGDVVVHLFDAAHREKYRLEDLWHDAPRVAVELPA
ncbi:MAG: ribosome silencing factor [Fimbriimonadaceae bacterium]|nr:ribosome silencing factor [Fimbriimonadaceae bacterium]